MLKVRRFERSLVALLLICQVGVLSYSAYVHSPVSDEPGHLVAGVACVQLGRYELYRVNPPLVKMLAALPVLAMQPTTSWKDLDPWPGRRPEFLLGRQFAAANPDRWPMYFTVARWSLIPIVLLGGLVCWRWARAIAGRGAGIIVLALWCGSPEILAHGALITPDASAASFALLAGYVYWGWWRRGGLLLACCAGTATAVALATKFTLVLLLPTWVALWVAGRAMDLVRGWPEARTRLGTGWQLAAALGVSLFGINLFYCFDGVFTPLGDFTFVSGKLSGVPDVRSMQLGGNRFSGTWLGELPVPLPREFVQGIDCQQLDFDHKDWSYLCGEWRLGGWWYYYLAAMAFKSPAAWWPLVALAILGVLSNGQRISWCDQAALLLPAATVIAVVSAQTGFNHHYRYVLPALPFLFVWVGVNVATFVRKFPWPGVLWRRGIVVVLVAAYLLESLAAFPHSLSFFNLFVGGPSNGHRLLSDSCVDWGQDLFLLRKWHADHPEARPFYATYYSPNDQVIKPSVANGVASDDEVTWPGPWPGWHAMSVTALHPRDSVSRVWAELAPVDRIGYSIVVFHLTEEGAAEMRRKQAKGQSEHVQ